MLNIMENFDKNQVFFKIKEFCLLKHTMKRVKTQAIKGKRCLKCMSSKELVLKNSIKKKKKTPK